jgi:hypothetical protein
MLRTIVENLDAIEIRYMVVGSFASSAHGEPRSTRDLDVVIDPTPAQLDNLLAVLPPDRFYVDHDVARDALRRRSMFNVIEIETAWKLDFMILKARPFSTEELQRRQKTTILGLEVSAATPEDTIISKLEWAKLAASDRQLEDAAGVLRVSGALDLAYIERWITELGLLEQWHRVRAMV